MIIIKSIILLFLALLVSVLILSGCASTKYSSEQVAGFYKSNYSTVSSNEKAQMLMDDLKAKGIPYSTETVTYKVKVIHVYNSVGVKIYPEPLSTDRKYQLFPLVTFDRSTEE